MQRLCADTPTSALNPVLPIGLGMLIAIAVVTLPWLVEWSFAHDQYQT
jgi:hypothetical protein